MIADPLDIFRAEQQMRAKRNVARVLHHVGQEIAEDRILERVGDLAKNIAKRSIRIGGEPRSPREIVGLRHMNEVAAELLKDVLDAYAQRDTERARAVWERDAELDALEDSVFRDLLTHMMEDPRNISYCAHLLFCSKNVERIGDHATNIAETVNYLVTGQPLPGERPKGAPDLSANASEARA